MPVHQLGLAADLDTIATIARRNNIALVEDAAPAIGATYKGRRVGGLGYTACFSFHPRKAITTGEGGMLVSDNAAMAERARRLRAHGMSLSDLTRHRADRVLFEEYDELGYNYRMTDLQAAIGIEQLAKLDALLARRQTLALRYDDAFRTLADVQTPARPSYADHSYQSYAIRLLPGCQIDRDDLLRTLVEAGISCRRGIPPIHLEPLYRERTGPTSLPITEDVAGRSVFLPIFASLSDDDQAFIIDRVTTALRR
jgi:perosamine synthetase